MWCGKRSPYCDPSEVSSVLVLMLHGIGDVICSTPLVQGIRSWNPGCKITAVVRSDSETGIFGGKTQVDDFLTFDVHRSHSIREYIEFLWKIRKREFDLIVIDHATDRFKAPLLALWSGAKYRVGENDHIFSFIYTHAGVPDFSLHKVVNNWRILAAMGIHEKPEPTCYFDGNDRRKVRALIKEAGVAVPDKLLVVHPGSGEAESHKRWPVRFFSQVVHFYRKHKDITVVLVGGSDEVALCRKILPQDDSHAVSLAGKLTLRETAALLADSCVVVGNDSGVLHIASAVGARTISLFGPTVAPWTAPFKHTTVISKNLPCSPCYFSLPHGCGLPVCMELIEVSSVISAIDHVIKERYVQVNE